jgi:APA family basic amino acid/polyamine antiporter
VPVLTRDKRTLLTVLGLTFGLAVTVGNTIGAGILRTPGTIAQQLPTFVPFLAVWVIGGLYALLGANALAELGTMLQRSGGQYVFVRRGLGDYAGFVVGWSDWISTCGAAAAVSIVVGEYAVILFPSFRAVEVVALMVLGAMTLVQWFGVRAGGHAQNVTSLLKAVALLVLIATCFYLGGRNPAAESFVPDREGSAVLAFIISLQAVIYTYDGWSSAIYFSEEIRDPGRNIPRSMFGGVALVIVIYLLINVAFLRVVPLGTIAGENLAAGVVAQHLFGPAGDTIIRALTIIAMISAVNSNVLEAPRVLFAMSTDGLFWRGAREVNAGGTPDIALLISTILAAAFIVTGTFETVIAKLAFFFVANYTLSFITLFVLRRREPEARRPYRAWGHPFTTGLAVIASIAFLVGAVIEDPSSSLWAVGLLLLSYPVYLMIRGRATA